MSFLKDGKKPLSSRTVTAEMEQEIMGNTLTISGELKRELDAAGLEARWVSAKLLATDPNSHPRGWRPYFRKKTETTDKPGFHFGNDPDGLVRRGTMVLAVKPKETAENHRAVLKHRAERMSGQAYEKQRAQELRQMAREHNARAKIYEGYDENDSN